MICDAATVRSSRDGCCIFQQKFFTNSPLCCALFPKHAQNKHIILRTIKINNPLVSNAGILRKSVHRRKPAV